MAIQDFSLTLKGDQASVSGVGIVPQADGNITLEVLGTTKDSSGVTHSLARASLKVPAGAVPAIDNLLARALIELRKANGLEV